MTPRVEQLISEAEKESSKICGNCGKPLENPGDYLSICIMRDYISISNEYWGVGSEYPVSIMRFKGEPLDD